LDPTTDIELRTGNQMPCMGLGTWQLTHDTAETVADALDLGHRLIDTSGDYDTQTGIGEAIRRSGAPRDSFYLVTKIEETDDAYAATRKNLSELQLDFADLILIHRPPLDGGRNALARTDARKSGRARQGYRR
jgi:2,5-diketo-D-gluconate reductase A